MYTLHQARRAVRPVAQVTQARSTCAESDAHQGLGNPGRAISAVEIPRALYWLQKKQWARCLGFGKSVRAILAAETLGALLWLRNTHGCAILAAEKNKARTHSVHLTHGLCISDIYIGSPSRICFVVGIL